jgi:hypothetical protein
MYNFVLLRLWHIIRPMHLSPSSLAYQHVCAELITVGNMLQLVVTTVISGATKDIE